MYSDSYELLTSFLARSPCK